MNDLIVSAVVTILTGLGIGAIFWFVHQNKLKQEELIRNNANLRGWDYEAVREPLRSGYRLHGSHNDVEWMLEGINHSASREAGPGSSEVSSTTRWHCLPAPLPGGVTAIGPRPAVNTASLAGAMSSTIVQAALRLMLGDQASAVAAMKEVTAGSGSFQQRYMVWAQDEQDAVRLVSSDVEAALMAWPDKLPLIIKIGPSGMEILHKEARLTRPADLNAFVDLGCRLLDAWQSRNKN